MSWQEEIRGSIANVEQLRKTLPMTDAEADSMRRVIETYPMAVTPYYLSLIDKDDPDDPIRRMCVPAPEECGDIGRADTSGEGQNTKAVGLQHKYDQTALVLSTNVCAMYCRHCFRKRMVGLSAEEINKQLDEAVAYIAAHDEINNVLVTGGDSLMLDNGTLGRYLEALSGIGHIEMIRFGTRMPVVLPERVSGDAELIDLFARYSRKTRIYVVTQFNHPREMTGEAKAAIDALLAAGVVVSNQTVLLRGVNDDADTLIDLMNGLVRLGIVPYYLFQCRPARGVCGQFQLPLDAGYALVERAKARLNGHAKRFRYVMSHVTGKIEILGRLDGGDMLFKYHQAKRQADQGRLFSLPVAPDDCWLPDASSRLTGDEKTAMIEAEYGDAKDPRKTTS